MSVSAYTGGWVNASLAGITKPGDSSEGGEIRAILINTIFFRNTIATCMCTCASHVTAVIDV